MAEKFQNFQTVTLFPDCKSVLKILRAINFCMIWFTKTVFLLVFKQQFKIQSHFPSAHSQWIFTKILWKKNFNFFHTVFRVLTSISWCCLLTSCFERCFCLRVQLISLLHCWYYFCNVDKLNFRGSIRKNSYCVTLWQIKTLCNSLKTL